MRVFLFMYVEAPVRWVGSVRQNPFQPCDTTKSVSYEINALVTHILNHRCQTIRSGRSRITSEHAGCVCVDTAVFGCEGLVGLCGILDLKKSGPCP